MRRGRIFIYLALIIILGLVATFVLYRRFQQAAQDSVALDAVVPTEVQVIEEMEVVVVAQNTPRGTLLDETLLTTIRLPKNDAVDGMFFNELGPVVGRRAKFDLDSGIPLTASMLVDTTEALSSAGSVASMLINKGKVAVSIPIDRLSSVSYAPRPGDHVSVIVTMMFVDIDTDFQTIFPNAVGGVTGPSVPSAEATEPVEITAKVTGASGLVGRTELDPLLNELIYVLPSETQRPRLVSQTLLPDVVVLQVGDFEYMDEEDKTTPEGEVDPGEELVEPVPEGEAAQEPAEVIKPPDVITLLVRPQDAVTLNYLTSAGAELTLALRAAGDDSIESTESVTLQYLIDEYNITVPAKLPYSQEPRIDGLGPVLPVEEPSEITGGG